VLIPVPILIWSGPDSLSQIQIFSGDRGTGKTRALVSVLNQILTSKANAAKIQVIAGHRHFQRRQFLDQMVTQGIAPWGGMHLNTLPQWTRSLLSLPGLLPKGFQAVSANEITLLMQIFWAHNPDLQFHFPGSETQAWNLLLTRHQEKCLQGYSWQEFHARSQALETDPLAPQMNAFLEAFQNWLLDSALLDYPLQLSQLLKNWQSPLCQNAIQQTKYWLIDDFEQWSPLEKKLLMQLLSFQSQFTLAWNPWDTASELPEVLIKAGAEIRELEDPHPLQALAKRLDTLFQAKTLTPEVANTKVFISRSQNTATMLSEMETQLQTLISEGIEPGEIVWVTWSLNDSLCLEIETRLSALGISLEIYRGSRMIQRDPLVNLLLSLLRLVAWQTFADSVAVPKLNGFDMSQIFAFCLGLDGFELAHLREKFGNRVSAWGQFLQTLTGAKAENLKAQVADLRRAYQSGQKNLSEIAQELWQSLILPIIKPELSVVALRETLHRLAQWQAIRPDLPDSELLFFEALFRGELRETGDPVLEPQPQALKLMTLHRLCELKISSRYQFWFDLSAPAWMAHASHPLNSRQLFSSDHAPSVGWSLEREEALSEQAMGRLLRKGLRFCQHTPFFFACDYDALAQKQNQETLVRFLSLDYSPVETI